MIFSITGINVEKGKNNFNVEDIPGSIKSALNDSRIKINEKNCRNAGIFLGTTFHNSDIRRTNTDNYRKGGVRVVNPADFPKCLISYLGGHLSTAFGLKGANSTLSSGVSSGVDAFIQAGYFAKRTKKNKAVVVELNEKISDNLNCLLGGSACLIIENNIAAGKNIKKTYADVLGVESFFEREGENKSLSRSIEEVLKKCTLSLADVDCIFVPAKHSFEENAMEGISNLLKQDSLHCHFKRTAGETGLFLIADVLKNMDFTDYPGKKSIISLFLFLGKDSNRTCAVIKIYRGRK